MTTLNLSPSEYADLTVSFLLDKMLHPDEIVPDNENFNELAEKLKGLGVKPHLTKYYINMDSMARMNYKRIKDGFDGSSDNPQTIKVNPAKVDKKKSKKEKEGFLKKVGKAVLKKLIGQGPMSLSKEEWQTLNEMIEWMDQIREEAEING